MHKKDNSVQTDRHTELQTDRQNDRQTVNCRGALLLKKKTIYIYASMYIVLLQEKKTGYFGLLTVLFPCNVGLYNLHINPQIFVIFKIVFSIHIIYDINRKSILSK